MVLTIDECRYQQIKAKIEQHRLERKAAGAAQVDWDRQPAFISVDEFFDYLDRTATPKDRPARSRRNPR